MFLNAEEGGGIPDVCLENVMNITCFGFAVDSVIGTVGFGNANADFKSSSNT